MGIRARAAILAGGMLLCGVGAVGAPKLVETAIPQVEAAVIQAQPYASSVTCTGTLEMKTTREIYATASLVPSQVLVTPGDYVVEGQVVVQVDTQASQAMSAVGTTPKAADAVAQIPEAYLAAAAAMGITSQDVAAAMESRGATTSREKAAAGEIPSQILAPISGVVTQVEAKADSVSSVGSTLLTIGDSSHYIVNVSVKESAIAAVALRNHAEIRGSGMGGKVYEGYVSAISPVAKREAGSTEAVVPVEIVVYAPDEMVKAGFSSTVKIYTEDPRELLLAPYEAIGQDAQNTEYVMVYQDGQAHRRDIETGRELADGVEILSGLLPGETVLIGPDQLQDGTKVRLEAWT